MQHKPEQALDRRESRRRSPASVVTKVALPAQQAPTWGQLPGTQRTRLVATLGRMVRSSRERRQDDE